MDIFGKYLWNLVQKWAYLVAVPAGNGNPAHELIQFITNDAVRQVEPNKVL